ncbi:uncharacterized protein A4U43_C01F29610 [Asparagus officinalis]|uniref:DUF7647 domain-containing protein n=1 Tax=Asparagus officinalis TaxID=4686 RepID=A0A5P1FUZ7_ASPOF|nr:uncharacterized protein A4U43_C01F29610 [Asparagus officinalis]
MVHKKVHKDSLRIFSRNDSLIQLAWQGPSDVDLPQHSISTHTMELQTYIEEPSPRVPPSLQINSVDPHPKIRHDFVFSKQEDVNAYWEILEYCYATADPVSASLSSLVLWFMRLEQTISDSSYISKAILKLQFVDDDELFRIVASSSTYYELLNHVKCNTSIVYEVLRVSYDKQQKRAQRTYKISNSRKQERCTDTNSESVLKKRRLSEEKSVERAPDSTSRETSCVHGDNMDRDPSIADAEVHDNLMETCTNTSYDNPTTEFEPHEEDDQSLSFIKSCNVIRQRRFTWTDEFDRQLVMQYARYRVIMGERFSRVIWSSVPNLPTDPLACGRRMNKINSDMSTRRAVMRLCNLLGERYGRYLNNGRTVRKNILNLGDSAKSIQQSRADETIDRHLVIPEDTETSFRQSSWDDFDHPDIKMAVDEVLRCKKMTKAEHTKKSGARHGQGCLDTPTDGTNLDFQEHVTPTEHISASHAESNASHCETGTKNSNILQISDQSRSISHHSRRKFLKLSNSRRIEVERKVCESTTVANAVELLKLVFLSNSAVPEGQTSLAETLQLYPKSDLIAAFNYLREKDFVVIRNGNQPLLSQKFWHNASSSPFPVDSGKRAALFSSWLHEKDKYLKDGIDLGKDIQCGEIFHLFAFVASGEVLISPTLPEEGIGEADESKSSQCLLTADDDLNYLNASSNEAEIPCDGEKDKKQKSLWKVDSDFCSRREKGFPGIKVFINRATIPRVDALQCAEANEDRMCSSIYNEMKRPSYSDIKSVTFESLLSRSSLPDNSGCKIQLEGDPDRSPCYEMSRYAENLAAVMVGSCGVFNFCPELFRSVCSVIDKAGEQGLSVEEISRLTSVQEVRLTEVVVETLEIFQLAFKVNAYDCVRVVASSHRSKYFIGLHADLASCENDKGMRLSDGHKLTRLDKPPKPGVPQGETQLSRQSLTSDECNQTHALRNESENRLSSVAGVSNGHQSLLPWINGDGSTNSIVYKGLTRRALGTVMQNPGILEEDIIHQMDVLNPQSCRRLLERMVLDNHLITRMVVHQTASISSPSILHSLFQSDLTKQRREFRKHYFANPLSTSLL